jgi:methionine synthase I (cobalamin-dependent)
MKNKKVLIGVSICSLALILAIGLATQAVQSVSAAELPQIGGPFGGGRGMMGPNAGEALAQALGITTDELNNAYQQAVQSAVQEGVDKGLITQAQADAILNGSGRFGGRGMLGWLFQNGVDFEAHLAKALGISVDELQAAYTKAAEIRLEQAVADGRITEEEANLLRARHALFNNESFQNSMQTAFENAVKEAVTNGVITQAQADLILQQGGFGMRGGFMGFGGCHGGGRGGFGRGW